MSSVRPAGTSTNSDYDPTKLQVVWSARNEKDLPLLKRQILDSNEYVRAAAAACLGQIITPENKEEIKKTLLSLLDDSSERVRQAAIKSLGFIGGEDVKAALVNYTERKSTGKDSCQDAYIQLRHLQYDKDNGVDHPSSGTAHNHHDSFVPWSESQRFMDLCRSK